MSNPNQSLNKPASQVQSRTSGPLAPLYTLLGVAIIVFVAFAVYFPSLHGGFIFDDELYVTNQKIIFNSDALYQFWFTANTVDYYPVYNTVLWIEWRLWGMKPTGYHIVNLVLHIAESLLIWLILRKLSIIGAFLAAVIFVVHPVNVESVAWITQLKDMLALLFFLLSILWYLKAEFLSPPQKSLYSSGAGRWYWLSLAAFVLAMLSKGSAAMLPIVLLLIIWWLRPLIRWDLVRTAPFFLVAIALTRVHMWFQTHGTGEALRNVGFIERLLGAGGTVWFYLYKALLPVNLVFVYPQWNIEAGNLLWWLPLLAVFIVTAILWRYKESRCRPILFAWGIFCTTLVPVMGFVDSGFMRHSLVADHYQHIAIIGVIALVSAGFSTWRLQAHRSAHVAIAAVAFTAVGTLALMTWRQSGLYNNALTLYQATLEKNPDCWMIQNNLGNKLAEIGRMQEAIDHFEQALRLNPEYAEAYNNLGLAMADLGLQTKAIEYYRQALRLKPDSMEVHNNLGNSLINIGQLNEAIEHYEQALRIKPNIAEAHNNLGGKLFQAGRLQEAIEHFRQALALKPDYHEAYNNLGATLFQAGRRQEAIELYERALAINPNYAETHNNLGVALGKIGRHQEAIKHYEQALQLKPDYVEAQNNLGLSLLQTGRPEEAIEHLKEALRLRPDYFDAWNNLALTYASMRQSAEAIETAQKALELAKSQGQTAIADKIEAWLDSYRSEIVK